ncbi:MAG TPA: ankyrin repeat domain-containing protein [Capsulimonadaceae bacterium]
MAWAFIVRPIASGELADLWSSTGSHVTLPKLAGLVFLGADVNVRDPSGGTPLLWAVDDVNCVRFLVSHGADVNAMDNEGSTALFNAATSGNIEVVKYLIANGATDTDGALQGAARSGDASCLKYIWSTIPKVYADTATALLMIVRDPTSAEFLLSKGANVNYIEVGSGNTPLMSAVRTNNSSLAECLIAHGANVNAGTTENGSTLRGYARSHPGIAALLKAAGAR